MRGVIGTGLAILVSTGLLAQGPFEARIAEAETVLGRFYRGERLEAARERSNKEIDAYNAHSKAFQAELDAARSRMEQARTPAQSAFDRLKDLDKELKNPPAGGEGEKGANVRYAAKVKERNELAHQLNALNTAAQKEVDAFNALAKRVQEDSARERQRVLGGQEALNARFAAYEAFIQGGRDLDFFTGLNRLLADLRKGLRAAPGDAGLQKALAKVRGFRRELAAWAMAGHAGQPNGLVIVEALVEDEPCWFIVDTGAMDTILSAELADAVGLGGTLGEQARLTAVGGLRVPGRAFRIPRLGCGGQLQQDVAALAVRPSDVGIDGLLGQSFLKAFVYTIDERKPEKLLLTRR